MAILTASGRTALATAIAAQPLHCAWGSGSASWDATPAVEQVTETSLVNELGRRTVSEVGFVIPDDAGIISVPGQNYSLAASGIKTNNVYMRFTFGYTDAPTSLVREIAVFANTVTATGLPAGQTYFIPSQITNPGTLLMIQRIPVVTRSSATRQTFEFVLTL